MLISTQPCTDAEKAIIRRVRQLTDFCWTPIRDIPTYTRQMGNTVLPAGETIQGFLYASEEKNDKFFCENVSFETFLSAIPNPHSKLYQPGKGAFDAPSYGIVCNGLVRYAFGIRRRVPTACWHTIPGMRMIKPHGKYTVEDIKLCDVLYAFGEGESRSYAGGGGGLYGGYASNDGYYGGGGGSGYIDGVSELSPRTY